MKVVRWFILGLLLVSAWCRPSKETQQDRCHDQKSCFACVSEEGCYYIWSSSLQQNICLNTHDFLEFDLEYHDQIWFNHPDMPLEKCSDFDLFKQTTTQALLSVTVSESTTTTFTDSSTSPSTPKPPPTPFSGEGTFVGGMTMTNSCMIIMGVLAIITTVVCACIFLYYKNEEFRKGFFCGSGSCSASRTKWRSRTSQLSEVAKDEEDESKNYLQM